MATIETVLQGFSVATDQGSLGFCGVTLIRGTKTILVDAAHVGRRQLLLNRFKEMGIAPSDVDYVFLTHAHWDHSLNIDVFPRAKVLIHPAEREYCKQPRASDWATPLWVSQMLESSQLQEVKDGEEIDDGVTVISTPGHSKGSMGLLVRDAQGTIAVSGDALSTALSVSTGLPRLAFWDLEEAKQSIRRLLDRAQVFYPGHDRPFRNDGGKITYLQPTSLHIFGLPAAGEGEGGVGFSYGLEPAYQTGVFT